MSGIVRVPGVVPVQVPARAALAVSLLVGACALAAGMFLVLVTVVVVGLLSGVDGILLSLGVVLLLVVTAGLGRTLWAVRSARRAEPDGVLLAAEDQPELWAEARWVAATVATGPPDAIRLVPEATASVWEDARLLGLLSRRRVLVVGAPLVIGLTKQELRAVLAHELGHYSHREAAITEVVHRGHVTLAHLVDALGRERLTGRLLAAFAASWFRVARAVTSRQEVEADAWSHRVAGRAATVRALRKVAALEVMWERFLEDYAFPVEGVRPDDLFGGFRELLASPRRQQEMAALGRSLAEVRPGPHDTHAPLHQRVSHVESLPDNGIGDDGAPAGRLFDDPDGVLQALEAHMSSRAGLDPMPWSWIAETAGVQRARANASLLVRATREPGCGAATLRHALVALAQHDGRRLVQPLVAPDLPPKQVIAVARTLVEDAVSAALVEHCGARFTVDWDANRALAEPDGQPIDVAGMVSSVEEAGSASWLVQALEEEGVPASFAVVPPVVDPDSPLLRGPVAHSVAACSTRLGSRVLVVADAGLVVKRLGLAERVTAARLHGPTHHHRAAVRHIAKIPLSELLADKRVTVLDWDRVGPVRLSDQRLVLGLDGRQHRLRIRHVAGDLLGSLHHHLGERIALAQLTEADRALGRAPTSSALH